jgi:hypothetical protein
MSRSSRFAVPSFYRHRARGQGLCFGGGRVDGLSSEAVEQRRKMERADRRARNHVFCRLISMRYERAAMKSTVCAFGAVFVLMSCSPPSPEHHEATQAATSSNAATPDDASAASVVKDQSVGAAPSNWSYSENKDEMRGTTTKYAQTDSENELDFGFPYGSSHGTLMLRKRPSDGLNVILSIKGQFICNAFEGETVTVKFDSGPIEHFGCNETADGSPGYLFIEASQKFVRKLRKAKKVIIEAQYFEHGRQQLTFDVAGLNW